MWQIHSIWVEVWSSGMTGAKSQKALIYNPASSKDLCGLDLLVFLLNRNKKRARGKEKKPQCVFHTTSYSYCKTNKELHNCGPGRFAILCRSNMQHNNPRLFWGISRSGHVACHAAVHALHISLIKPEWFWLHVPIFWLKALEKISLVRISTGDVRHKAVSGKQFQEGKVSTQNKKRTTIC